MHPLLQPIPEEQLKTLSKRDLLIVARGEQQIRLQMQAELERLEALKKELEDKIVQIDGRFVTIRHRLFGQSSEKSSSPEKSPQPSPCKKRGPSKKAPSERYPNVPVVEQTVAFEKAPCCRGCGEKMAQSTMTESSEHLTVIPKQFLIVRQYREKYRCQRCHGDIQTAPPLPRIKPGSGYSDELILDAALSKFCDLIPMERYSAMAARQGVEGLPANSLIAATHHLADFLSEAVERVKEETLRSRVLHGDETPHRMLEGDEKSHWYLWGFSGSQSCYFDCHDTRSGEVAAEVLKKSCCEVFVSDVFSGYEKGVNKANEERLLRGLPEIQKAYCNAHARRKFKEAEPYFPKESAFYLDRYRKLYKIEADSGGKADFLEARRAGWMLFEEMARQATRDLETVSSQSLLAKALRYFLKNYGGLTVYLAGEDIPIDNNRQERVLRNPVIGRKTWYGTHSRRGAKTAAMLFTLVESCKLSKVNPRQYFPELVKAIHSKQPVFTPSEYRLSLQSH